MSMIHVLTGFIVTGDCVVDILTSHTLFRLLVTEFAKEEVHDSNPHCVVGIISLHSVLEGKIVCSQTIQMNECSFWQVLQSEV